MEDRLKFSNALRALELYADEIQSDKINPKEKLSHAKLMFAIYIFQKMESEWRVGKYAKSLERHVQYK